ncbi:MAG TPA: DNA alkylation repair protein [Chitinophagaceae bacterium]|nr:DNA alkylation repair protein [Chitinophagaceae bacterium]
MTAQQVLTELESLGLPSIKKVLVNHGIKEPFYGVKIEELKKIQKKIKKDNPLALQLFDTGVYDAMYLAGLIADPEEMSKRDLQKWVEKAGQYPINEYTVAWVASESKWGEELALEWIESKNPFIACSGWSTMASIAALKKDEDLNIPQLKKLMQRAAKDIPTAPNRVRYTMNGFVITVGSYVKELTEEAIKIGKSIGHIEIDMGNTSCKVPYPPDYIEKVKARGTIGKKRKTAMC